MGQNPSGIKLSELYAGEKTVKIDYHGCAIEITYKTCFWTCKVEAWYFDGEGTFATKNAKLILDNVTKWNITDDAGKPLPITQELVGNLDVWLTNLVVDAMIKGVQPDPPKSQD